MTRRLLFVTGVLTIAVGAAPAHAAKPTCHLKHGHVLMANTKVEVLWRPATDFPPPDRNYFSCHKKTGRLLFLGNRSDENAILHFQLAGEYVAYESRSGSSQGVGSTIEVMSVRRGRTLDVGGSLRPDGFDKIVFRLSPRGTVVLAEGIPGFYEVLFASAEHPRVQLAHGNIDLDSLALSASGNIAYWMQDGQPQFASLLGL